MEEALRNLLCINHTIIDDPILRRLNNIVLSDIHFQNAPGGSEHHHNYRCGLIIHVNEVMNNVFQMTNNKPSDELITAVIWHDYMKIKDYEMDGEKILKTPYRKLVNHVAGSALDFHLQAHGEIPDEQLERIEHLLLSHHGRREWGSPVEPQTAEAYILHTADMMSAHGCNL